MEIVPALVFLGLIFLAVAVLGKPLPPTEYRYKFQRHPFDDPQYFTVLAEDPEAADDLALERLKEMLLNGTTVVNAVYRSYQ